MCTSCYNCTLFVPYCRFASVALPLSPQQETGLSREGSGPILTIRVIHIQINTHNLFPRIFLKYTVPNWFHFDRLKYSAYIIILTINMTARLSAKFKQCHTCLFLFESLKEVVQGQKDRQIVISLIVQDSVSTQVNNNNHLIIKYVTEMSNSQMSDSERKAVSCCKLHTSTVVKEANFKN